MVLLFVDSKHKHFKELIGERCIVGSDLDTWVYIFSTNSEKFIKFKITEKDLIHLGEYTILRDEDSIFVFKDMNSNSLKGE